MTNAEARFNKIHIRKVYACLAVTCHLHFWQNDRDFLRATVVTRGWNGYRDKSQHRKSTLEKKILLPFQQGFEPATFQSWVRCSNHWAIPAPKPRRRFETCFLYLAEYSVKNFITTRQYLVNLMCNCWIGMCAQFHQKLISYKCMLFVDCLVELREYFVNWARVTKL